MVYENINVNNKNPNIEYWTELSLKDFVPLGKKLREGLSKEALLQALYDGLNPLVSTKGLKGSDGKYIRLPKQKLVQIYLPWNNEFYLGYINGIKRRETDEGVDARIEIKLYAHRHDTRDPDNEEDPPIPISLNKYFELEEEGRLKSAIWVFRVLNIHANVFNPKERLKFYVYEEEELVEEVEALKWWV